MLILGLVISLVMAPAALELAKRLHVKLSDIGPYLVAWLTTIIVLMIATTNLGPWRRALGVNNLTSASIYWGVPAVSIAIVFLVLNIYLPRWIGYRSQKQRDLFQPVLYLPLWKRCFFVITSAVTEEVLYRAYAVGVGAHVLGSYWVAAAVSVVVFTIAHFRYGIAQLPQVFVLAVGLTLLFIATGNLWLCICVHMFLNGSMLAKPTPNAQCAEQPHGQAG